MGSETKSKNMSIEIALTDEQVSQILKQALSIPWNVQPATYGTSVPLATRKVRKKIRTPGGKTRAPLPREVAVREMIANAHLHETDIMAGLEKQNLGMTRVGLYLLLKRIGAKRVAPATWFAPKP